MSARFVSVVGLLLVGCVFGNGSPGKGDPFGPGLWPLTTGDRRPWAGTLERQWLGPLIHQEAHLREGSIEERRLEVRPLYSWRATERETEHDLLLLVVERELRPPGGGVPRASRYGQCEQQYARGQGHAPRQDPEQHDD